MEIFVVCVYFAGVTYCLCRPYWGYLLFVETMMELLWSGCVHLAGVMCMSAYTLLELCVLCVCVCVCVCRPCWSYFLFVKILLELFKLTKADITGDVCCLCRP